MTDIFISYCHTDEDWKDELKAHLNVLQHHGGLSVWDDRQIKAGDDWYPAIKQALESARVAILLISRDFLNSEFVNREEIPVLLERRKAGGLRVIPLIVWPCGWRSVPWLADLQGATKDNEPLARFALKSYELEAELARFTDEVRALLQATKADESEEKCLQWKAKKQQPKKLEFKRPEESDEPEEKPIVGRKLGCSVTILLTFLLSSTVYLLVPKPLNPVITPEAPQGQQNFEAPTKWEAKLAAEATEREVQETGVAEANEPEMVRIPAGSFEMGCVSGIDCEDDEKPVRTVTIPAFEVGKHEVTFAEWDACVADGGCSHKPDEWGRGNQPVMRVSWNDTQEYVRWLNQKTGKQYRLLTEAEWEYVARAGTKTPYSTGNCITTEQANYDGNYAWEAGNCPKTGVYRENTTNVGSFAANPWGLYDLHGNVWEWAQDCYKNSYEGAPSNGTAVKSSACEARVLRGGSWGGKPWSLRSAYRFRGDPSIRYGNIGFRLARTF